MDSGWNSSSRLSICNTLIKVLRSAEVPGSSTATHAPHRTVHAGLGWAGEHTDPPPFVSPEKPQKRPPSAPPNSVSPTAPAPYWTTSRCLRSTEAWASKTRLKPNQPLPPHLHSLPQPSFLPSSPIILPLPPSLLTTPSKNPFISIFTCLFFLYVYTVARPRISPFRPRHTFPLPAREPSCAYPLHRVTTRYDNLEKNCPTRSSLASPPSRGLSRAFYNPICRRTVALPPQNWPSSPVVIGGSWSPRHSDFCFLE